MAKWGTYRGECFPRVSFDVGSGVRGSWTLAHLLKVGPGVGYVPISPGPLSPPKADTLS